MCLLTNERYKTYQTGFSFRCLGHAPGVGLGGTVGGGGGLGVPKTFFPKFNQIWCVRYLHEWHMQRHKYLGPRLLGPWGGAKRSNIIKSQLQSHIQRFLIYKHIRLDFHSVPWVMHAPGFGTWGCWGGIILWTWSCGISNPRGWAVDQDTLKNFILGSNWWPWDGVKGSNYFH